MADSDQAVQQRWALRDVDRATIRTIKIRAASESVSMAEALKRIVIEWEALKAQDKPHDEAQENAHVSSS